MSEHTRQHWEARRFIVGDCCGRCGKMLPDGWWQKHALDTPSHLPCGHHSSSAAMKTGVRWYDRKTGELKLEEK